MKYFLLMVLGTFLQSAQPIDGMSTGQPPEQVFDAVTEQVLMEEGINGLDLCIADHSDCDEEGPHGAVKVDENIFAVILDVGGTSKVLFFQNVVDENGQRQVEKMGNGVSIECINLDANTSLCIISDGQRIRVLIFCRVSNHWSLCQNDTTQL